MGEELFLLLFTCNGLYKGLKKKRDGRLASATLRKGVSIADADKLLELVHP